MNLDTTLREKLLAEGKKLGLHLGYANKLEDLVAISISEFHQVMNEKVAKDSVKIAELLVNHPNYRRTWDTSREAEQDTNRIANDVLSILKQ